MDLLSLLGTITNDTPKGGEKGNFGLGGGGGTGGRGGSSYTYMENNRSHTNAGGSDGPNGVAGNNGEFCFYLQICCYCYSCMKSYGKHYLSNIF